MAGKRRSTSRRTNAEGDVGWSLAPALDLGFTSLQTVLAVAANCNLIPVFCDNVEQVATHEKNAKCVHVTRGDNSQVLRIDMENRKPDAKHTQKLLAVAIVDFRQNSCRLKQSRCTPGFRSFHRSQRGWSSLSRCSAPKPIVREVAAPV